MTIGIVKFIILVVGASGTFIGALIVFFKYRKDKLNIAAVDERSRKNESGIKRHSDIIADIREQIQVLKTKADQAKEDTAEIKSEIAKVYTGIDDLKTLILNYFGGKK